MTDARSRVVDIEVRFVEECGGLVATTVAKVDLGAVVRGRPVRSFPVYAGQRNYPGWLWTATTKSLVGYESLLERDRLWLADFDPSVRWIANQPFWMSGRDGARIRRHVPDFLLSTDHGFLIVDVKPEEMLAEVEVSEALDWCGRVCAARGWAYEVWSGDDPVLLRNVRFVAAGRRGWEDDEELLGKVAEAARPGMTLAQLEASVSATCAQARAAVFAVLWSGRCRVDLSRPLSSGSVLLEASA